MASRLVGITAVDEIGYCLNSEMNTPADLDSRGTKSPAEWAATSNGQTQPFSTSVEQSRHLRHREQRAIGTNQDFFG